MFWSFGLYLAPYTLWCSLPKNLTPPHLNGLVTMQCGLICARLQARPLNQKNLGCFGLGPMFPPSPLPLFWADLK